MTASNVAWRIPARIAAASLLALSCLAATALPASGQEGDAVRDASLVEEIDVRVIQVSFLAVDRDGKPVTDLARDEIEVRYRGDDLRVAFLDRIAEDPQGEPEIPEVRLRLDVPGVAESAPVTPPATGRAPNWFVIFVDAENDYRLQRPQAMQQVSKFVDEYIREGDVTAVLSYDGDMNLETAFTDSKARVLESVRKAFSRPPRPQIEFKRRMTDLIELLQDCVVGDYTIFDTTAQANTECVRRLGIEYVEERRPPAEQFIKALEGVIRYASGLNGHATVFAISHGVAVDPGLEFLAAARAVFGDSQDMAQMIHMMTASGDDARIDMQRMLELAVREDVTFHFVDRSTPPAAGGGARQRGFYRVPGLDPMASAYQAPQGDLREVAGTTGGLFLEQKDLYDALGELMDMERGRYTLGFHPKTLIGKLALKKVDIGTTRRGVKIVRSRGYYKTSRDLGAVRGRIALGRGEPSGAEDSAYQRVPFRVEVDPRSVGYKEEEGLFVAPLTLHVTVQSMEGLHLADAYHFVSHAYPESVWQSGQAEPVLINGWLEAPPGDYRISALVKNPELEREGLLSGGFRLLDPRDAKKAPAEGGAAAPSRPQGGAGS